MKTLVIGLLLLSASALAGGQEEPLVLTTSHFSYFSHTGVHVPDFRLHIVHDAISVSEITSQLWDRSTFGQRDLVCNTIYERSLMRKRDWGPWQAWATTRETDSPTPRHVFDVDLDSSTPIASATISIVGETAKRMSLDPRKIQFVTDTFDPHFRMFPPELLDLKVFSFPSHFSQFNRLKFSPEEAAAARKMLDEVPQVELVVLDLIGEDGTDFSLRYSVPFARVAFSLREDWEKCEEMLMKKEMGRTVRK